MSSEKNMIDLKYHEWEVGWAVGAHSIYGATDTKKSALALQISCNKGMCDFKYELWEGAYASIFEMRWRMNAPSGCANCSTIILELKCRWMCPQAESGCQGDNKKFESDNTHNLYIGCQEAPIIQRISMLSSCVVGVSRGHNGAW